MPSATEEEKKNLLEHKLRMIAASTNITAKKPVMTDIIGTEPCSVAQSIPVIPDIFTSAQYQTKGDVERLVTNGQSASKAYVNSFVPHVALELRSSIFKDGDEWIGACDDTAPYEMQPKKGAKRSSVTRQYEHQFPLRQKVLDEAVYTSVMTMTCDGSTDTPLWCFEVMNKDTRHPDAVKEEKSSEVRPALCALPPLMMNDVVLVLVPLSTVLRAKDEETPQGVPACPENVMATLPPKVKLLGCMVQIATVVHWKDGIANLAFVPPRRKVCSEFQKHLPFEEALRCCFDRNEKIFIKVCSSVSGALHAMKALRQVPDSRFAPMLYDPRAMAKVSGAYHMAMLNDLGTSDDFRRLHKQLLLSKKMDEWQAMAILAILFAVLPSHGLSPGGAASAQPPASWRSVPAPDVLLIEGPPGTGKTQTIATLLLNLLLQKADLRVLICAPSNCAVDNAVLRLRQMQKHVLTLGNAKDNESLRRVSEASVVRIGVEDCVAQDVLKLTPKVFIDDLVRDHFGDALERTVWREITCVKKQVACGASFVFCTLGSLNQVVKLHAFKPRFDLVLVDEISQATEPEVLQALMIAKNTNCKVVFAGDPKQLQPTVLCASAAAHGYKRSLLSRLVCNGHPSFILRTQYRMHPDIARFPNDYVYESKLQDAPLNRQRGLVAASASTPFLKRTVAQKLGSLPRMVFVNVEQSKQMHHVYSFRNKLEAEAIVRHMRQVRTHLQLSLKEFAARTGIITFYKAQQELLMSLLTPFERDSGLQVATVDSFQSQEKDIIFISCTRTLNAKLARYLRPATAEAKPRTGGKVDKGEKEDDHGDDDAKSKKNSVPLAREFLGFISDWHRTNVSLTRAKELCVVYAHAPLLLAMRQCCDACSMFSHGGELTAPTTVDSARREVIEELRRLDNDPLLLYELMQHAKEHTPGCTRDTPPEWKRGKNCQVEKEFSAVVRAAYVNYKSGKTLIRQLDGI